MFPETDTDEQVDVDAQDNDIPKAREQNTSESDGSASNQGASIWVKVQPMV